VIVMLDRVLRWIALDFDGHSWWAIALWLLLAQATLFAISLVVRAIWVGTDPYPFLIAMLIFASHVFLDATTVGMPKPALWTAAVTLFPPIGAIFYARRRYLLRRAIA
jgi:hypothetical protein